MKSNLQRYQKVGQVSFRRSYSGHEKLSDAELDSLEHSNPSFMYTGDTSEDRMLNICINLGIANKDELLLDKIATTLKDSIFISTSSSAIDTIYLNYYASKEAGTTSIKIERKKNVDSIQIESEVFSHCFYLLKLTDTPKKMFAFVDQYYIMNGDNYEVFIYEKK